MSQVSTIGLDLAKHHFEVHGVDASGSVTVRRSLRPGQVLARIAWAVMTRQEDFRTGAQAA